ncbi:DUF6397 family protein [Streptomyces sp. NBC_00259]|uniref:DUF6397 family protein n=1 Tax=Streptomyces sp. NBC_00259 TaxID=2903643 RepID=UPI002E2A3966|nr:DUF6397 family protein [Streptomyces sp. NBC_00259]
MTDDMTTGVPETGNVIEEATDTGTASGDVPGAGTWAGIVPVPGLVTGPGVGAGAGATLPFGRAAVALELKRGEFDLAVQLGHIRTTQGKSPGRPWVSQQEIERLRGADGFPDALRERVRTVGTAEAALLIASTPARFTRLARTGHLTPIRFYLNRYRAVVWLYLASEIQDFATRNPDLLDGRLPAGLRARLDDGEDWRARNWRGRRLGILLRQAEGPWGRTAAIASLLDPVQLAEVVDDPYERAHLERLRPEPPHGRTESLAVREITDRLLLADDPDEILWHRMSLALSLDEARASGQAPRPDGDRVRLPRPGSPGDAPAAGAGARPAGWTEPRSRPSGEWSLPAPPRRDGAARHRAPSGQVTRGLLARWRLRRASPSRTG